MKKIKSYTGIWNVEKVLYAINDFNLPFPVTQILLNIIESNQQAIITLTDNGRGILPEKIPHIFERMYQCDDSRSSKGNGLGLSIAKELVNAHKGTINVASTPNFETTFTITLPKAL